MEEIGSFMEDLSLVQPINKECFELSKKIERLCSFYRYPQAEKLIQTVLFPLFQRVDCNMNDRGLIYFLYGEYHTGKSYLLKHFAGLMKRAYPDIWKQNDLPIIKLDLNNHINTASQLLIFLLDAFGRPIDPTLLNQWQKMNLLKERLQERVITHLERCGTRLLILDECQKLLQPRNHDILDIFELLKDLSNRNHWKGALRTQIILCGTKDGQPMLEAAEWIQGRTQIIRMNELTKQDFGVLLGQIYKDFTTLGISKDWDLFVLSSDGTKGQLNWKMTNYLYGRTHGKVGLTVELIRKAIIHALDEGRLYPIKNDFDVIRLDENIYLQTNTTKENIEHNLKPTIHLSLADRCCIIDSCSHHLKPYKHYSSLKTHYLKQHPEIQLVYGEEK